MIAVAAVEALAVVEEASATAVVVEEPVEEPAVALAAVEVRLSESRPQWVFTDIS